MPESGIVVDRVNNFEFIGGAAGPEPVGAFSDAGQGVTYAASWNTIDPVSGTADFRFDFTFTRIPGAWNEWVNVGLSTEGGQEFDLTFYTQISITLKADRSRSVWIRVNSPAYEDVFGGAWSEFGSELSVSPTPSTVKLRLDRLYYPDWAKDAWTAGQGWTTADSEALLTVLRRFNGLIFAPAPTTDSSGEMIDAQESGYLQIDNIYFQ